VADQN